MRHSMNAESYNEAEALDRYFEKSVRFLMTDFERRSYYLAIDREKAHLIIFNHFSCCKIIWKARAGFI
jgi:hypothetical protein